MTRSLATIFAAALVGGCATPAPVADPKESFPGARAPERTAAAPGAPLVEGAPPAPAPPPATAADLADPRSYAARFKRSETCEQAARNAAEISRDRGWEVLRACVRKGNFTLIRRLLDGAWDRDLQSRSDAGMLIAQVVAARGGDVMGDLNMLRQRRVPIFALRPAAGHPELYRGRLLLMRARVDDLKTEKGSTTAKLAELALSGQMKFVEGETRYRSSYSSQSEGSGSFKTSKYGSGTVSGKHSGNSEYTSGLERKRTENTAVETGLEALGRLSRPDPFFEPGREFVVLARFDGMREIPSENEDAPESLPVLSIIGYAEPSASVVE